MRSPEEIKAEISALTEELADADNYWQCAQYRQIVLDELDACKSIDDLKEFLESSLVPIMVADYGKKRSEPCSSKQP